MIQNGEELSRVFAQQLDASDQGVVANCESLVRNKRYAAHVSKAGVTGHNTAGSTGTGTPFE